MGLPDKISGKSKQPGCEEIQAAVRKKYSEVSRSLEGKFTYPTGRDGAHVLGYDLSLLGDMPADVADTFCGVGNPFSIGPVNPGESVLDIGSGAGFDLIMASLMVGPCGRAGEGPVQCRLRAFYPEIPRVVLGDFVDSYI